MITVRCALCSDGRLYAVYPRTEKNPLGQLRCNGCNNIVNLNPDSKTFRQLYIQAKNDAFAMAYGSGEAGSNTLASRRLEARKIAQLARAFKQKNMLYCPNCDCDRYWTLTGVFGFPKCKVCETQMEARQMAVPYEDIDRSDLIDPTGKFAIIRPDSQSGHSPSTRYKTKKNAELAAARLLENLDRPGTFEVVRIVSRVTTQNVVRIINVK